MNKQKGLVEKMQLRLRLTPHGGLSARREKTVCFGLAGVIILGTASLTVPQTQKTKPTPTNTQSANASRDFSSYRPSRISQFDAKAILKRVQPEYPREAAKRGIQGRVTIKALVNDKGNVERACAVEGEPLLRSPAEVAALQWKLKPKYGLAFRRPITQKNPKNFAELYIGFDFKLDKLASDRSESSHANKESRDYADFHVSSAVIGRVKGIVQPLSDLSDKQVVEKIAFQNQLDPRNAAAVRSQHDSHIVAFIRHDKELQKGYQSEFTGDFVTIPDTLTAELRNAFPELRFTIAKMIVVQDFPARRQDLIIITNARSQRVVGYVWGPYWTLPPSKSFERLLKGKQVKSTEDAVAKVRAFAKLVVYAIDQGLRRGDSVGKVFLGDSAVNAELLRGGGAFRVLKVRLSKSLVLGKATISKPDDQVIVTKRDFSSSAKPGVTGMAANNSGGVNAHSRTGNRDDLESSPATQNCDFSGYRRLKEPHSLLNAIVKRSEPKYPALGTSAGARGTVIVRILVNKRGDVVAACVVEGHPSLRGASLAAAKQWKFRKNFGLASSTLKEQYAETDLTFRFDVPANHGGLDRSESSAQPVATRVSANNSGAVNVDSRTGKRDKVKVRFEVDGKEITGQTFSVAIYADGRTINPELTEKGFIVPPEISQYQEVDVRFIFGKYDLYFNSLRQFNFKSAWRVGVDTPPFDPEHILSEPKPDRELLGIYYMVFMPEDAEETIQAVQVYNDDKLAGVKATFKDDIVNKQQDLRNEIRKAIGLSFPSHANQVREQLIALGASAAPLIAEAIRSDSKMNPIKKVFLVDVIAHMDEEGSVPALIALLSEEDPFLRGLAVTVLGKLRASSAIPHLISLLSDEGIYQIVTQTHPMSEHRILVRDVTIESLQAITGMVLGPQSSKQEQAREWMQWWQAQRNRSANR